MNILIVDDDEDVKELYESWFSDEGHEVHTCEDSLEAGTFLAEETSTPACDLIVVDLLMPGLNGKDLIRLYRKNISLENQVPIIVLSGYMEEKYRRELDQVNDVYILEKPTNKDELMKLFNKIMN